MTSSRIETGRILTEAILQMTVKPSFLLQGSATGFYGPQSFGPVDEKRGSGSGFLAELVQQWESSVSLLAEAGLRVVYLRSGVVLDPRGGMLERLLKPFDFYAGTILGNGKQLISWIHLQDEVNAIAFLVENPSSSGPYNLTSPAPATMKEMVKEIARITRKPAFLNAPAFLLQAFLGQMAKETILASQQVLPSRLLAEGYRFNYDELGSALQDLLRKSVK